MQHIQKAPRGGGEQGERGGDVREEQAEDADAEGGTRRNTEPSPDRLGKTYSYYMTSARERKHGIANNSLSDPGG